MQKRFQKIGNGFMSAILRSPFHRMLSANTMLITFTGKKTGKRYTTPVNYAQAGSRVYVTSVRDRSWWKNLRGGAPVSLWIAGERIEGRGEVFEDIDGVRETFVAYLRAAPGFAKYFDVMLDEQGHLNTEDIDRAIQSRVMVRIEWDE
jgi:hypothetical protein